MIRSSNENACRTLCIPLLAWFVLWGGTGVAGAQETEAEADSSMRKARTVVVDRAKIQVARSDKFGPYLTDADGRALYMFKADTSKESTCYDQCAEVWPPLQTTTEPAAADPAVQEQLLGTIKRKDGTMQVTYNGWPLYYYVKDTGPGQTQGQDVEGFGAEWYLVSPEGREVHAEAEGGP